jgi:hemoglobin
MHDPTENPAERRARITAEIMAQTGIDEAMIKRLVHRFYGRVQQDPLLGPVFAARVDDWPAHLEKLCAFWSSVVLMSGRYHGQPMRPHLEISPGGELFDRWLALFEQTAGEVCPPPAAAHFVDKARRIADSLELGIASMQGRIAQPRHSRPVGAMAAAGRGNGPNEN